ncbi:sensor histidine kinase [Actinoplanes sp. L3-i22]|uniref:sensor histidine kinase n=1 Tax=Actinoplanes sp. L3-i22 TaxID=2836373 RepID=UPI001C74B213|nr:histidine kinase [Actinoplanes sp. L3-i22]BCY14164.1 two-component sensor histidine kinase [Actinoplanes sp. L3-i22]
MIAARRLLAGHPILADGLTALAVTAVSVAGYTAAAMKAPVRPLNWADVAGLGVAVVAMTLRRTWPRAMLFVATTAMIAHAWTHQGRHPLLIIAAGVCAYTTATRNSRRTTWLTFAGCVVTLYLGDVLSGNFPLLTAATIPVVTFVGMATAFGDATRNRRAYLAEVEERAQRAEQTREEEARRRVIQERLRIARELHDVVAHHIAVINVQAGAASHLLDRRPEQVRPALDHIRHAGDTVLKELASIVGVLRQSDDPDAVTEPTRGLARLPELLETVTAAGLVVRFRQAGAERGLPAVVDLAAYRITQEALTNAHKYGMGDAELAVTYTREGVHIEATNATRINPDKSGSGYGIVGMRERAAAADGTLIAYEKAGFFFLKAELPAPIEGT